MPCRLWDQFHYFAAIFETDSSEHPAALGRVGGPVLGAHELLLASLPLLLHGVPEAPPLPRAQPAAVAGLPVGGHGCGLRPRPPHTCRRRRLTGALLGAVHAAPPRRAGHHHSLLHGGLCTVEEAPAEPHHPGCTGHLRRGQAMARGQATCGSHGANLHLWDSQIWILGRAGSWGPVSRPWGPLCGQKRTLWPRLDTYAPILLLFSSDMEDVAHDMFYNSMNYFMNRASKQFRRSGLGQEERDRLKSDEGVNLAYKFAETQLLLIYDFLYTKFGSLDGVLHRLTILVINSTALALFVLHHKGGKRRSEAVKSNYGVADVAISYILLVGAVALEISSILMWFRTSYWPYKVCPGGGRSPRIVLSILKRLRPAPESNRLEWSGNLQQYNLIDEIIQDEKAKGEYGWLKWMMWRIGIKQQDDTTTKHVAISPEVKRVLLDKLRGNSGRLDLTSFRADWATSSSSGFGAAKQKVRGIFKDRDLVSSAFLWHLVTDICLVPDETPSKLRTCSQHLSNYIMHLVYKCNLMVDADGCLFFEECIKWIGAFCKDANYDKRDLLQRFRSDRDDSYIKGSVHRLASLATDVAFLLNSEVAAADRWEMIATVWMQMLCYIAIKCDHGFHAKQLSAGGEFLTHAKMLTFPIIRLVDPEM